MTKLAITQMGSRGSWAKNCDTAEALVRGAAKAGAELVLLQELFDADYFCIEQHSKFLATAQELPRHKTLQRFKALAKELGVVLPVSVFERAGQVHYNTTVIVDATGTELGLYRKSHIPDGPGYQEKFYFTPGDTGFKVWDTAVGRIGLGICWDQWFPECARAMALMGAEILLYPTAIGSEPPNPAYDSSTHWQNVMRGHAAANIMPVLASNRVGSETAPDGRSVTFYGRSFVADHTGEKLTEMDRVEEGFRIVDLELKALGELRRSWGVFRDRRPESMAHCSPRMACVSELPAIDVKGVSKIFPGTKVQDFAALDDVSVTIRKNEFFTLLGPSGCGKTTLLRMIAGFEYPTRGTILLHGSDIVGLPPNKRPVNTVFQSYALFPHMTVAENVGFGLQMLGKPQSEVNSRVVEMLRLVRMEDLSQRRTSQISGGQQQRVALARALAPKPQVLLLDEPLSALDAKLRKDMQIELKRMQSETGITFIFVTHDQEEALTMSDRIAVMNAGRILQVGNPQQIYGEPENRFVANFIGETNFLKASYEGAGKRLRLAAGGHVDAPSPQAMLRNGEITLMVRPEHAALTAPGRGALNGVVSAVVYFGTDTMIHLKLGDGTDFVVRQQNDRKGSNAVVQGDRRGIVLGPGAARVLAD